MRKPRLVRTTNMAESGRSKRSRLVPYESREASDRTITASMTVGWTELVRSRCGASSAGRGLVSHLGLPYGHRSRSDDREQVTGARNPQCQDWLLERYCHRNRGWLIAGGSFRGRIERIVLYRVDARGQGRHWGEGSGGDNVIAGGGCRVRGQEGSLVSLVCGVLRSGGRRRGAIMGDDEVEIGSLGAAGGMNSRCANGPVHGWLLGAKRQDVSSFAPIQLPLYNKVYKWWEFTASS
jgi:hypothetical protein